VNTEYLDGVHAQGLVAGLNAARRAQGLEPVSFPRNSSYLGTLVDDLVTKVCLGMGLCSSRMHSPEPLASKIQASGTTIIHLSLLGPVCLSA
jgi:folate-dependent tRNA-U54 methylase TrmFO/GidA